MFPDTGFNCTRGTDICTVVRIFANMLQSWGMMDRLWSGQLVVTWPADNGCHLICVRSGGWGFCLDQWKCSYDDNICHNWHLTTCVLTHSSNALSSWILWWWRCLQSNLYCPPLCSTQQWLNGEYKFQTWTSHFCLNILSFRLNKFTIFFDSFIPVLHLSSNKQYEQDWGIMIRAGNKRFAKFLAADSSR